LTVWYILITRTGKQVNTFKCVRTHKQVEELVAKRPRSNDNLVPIWFDLPQQFYDDLTDLAQMFEISPGAVLQRAVRALRSEREGRRARNPSKEASVLSAHLQGHQRRMLSTANAAVS
jgi:hypothetical protein